MKHVLWSKRNTQNKDKGVDITNITSEKCPSNIESVYRYKLVLFDGFFCPIVSEWNLQYEGKLEIHYYVLQTPESNVPEKHTWQFYFSLLF